LGRREGPSEERRTAILQAAEAVFTEKGYHGASTREIASRAGVSSALLYWFFPNKAGVFSAVLQERIRAQGVLEFPEEAMSVPPGVLLPGMMSRFARFMLGSDQVQLMRLVLRDADREPELAGALTQTIIGRALHPMAAYFRHQVQSGTMRETDPDFMAQAFMGMFVGLALRRGLLQEPASQTWDLEAYVSAAVDAFLHGMLPVTPVPDE
jgi:AcrR family transcriptional regulator